MAACTPTIDRQTARIISSAKSSSSASACVTSMDDCRRPKAVLLTPRLIGAGVPLAPPWLLAEAREWPSAALSPPPFALP